MKKDLQARLTGARGGLRRGIGRKIKLLKKKEEQSDVDRGTLARRQTLAGVRHRSEGIPFAHEIKILRRK